MKYEHSQLCEAPAVPKFNYKTLTAGDLSAVVTAGQPKLNLWVNLYSLIRMTVGNTNQVVQGHRNRCGDLCQWQNIYRDSVFKDIVPEGLWPTLAGYM